MPKRVVCFRSSFIFLLVLVLLTTFVSACAGPPQALMTASVTDGQAPLSVSFANKSKNAKEFQWDLGDGTIRTAATTEEAVSHTYKKAGTYSVKLTASKPSKAGPPQSHTETVTITVAPGPLLKVTVAPPEKALAPEETHTFTATPVDQFDNEIKGLGLVWSVTSGGGSINREGLLTAGTKVGTYELRVEAAEGPMRQAAAAALVINSGPLHRVVLEPTAATLEVGKEQKFTATALDQFDNPIPGLSYAFRAQEGAGKVEQDGKLTAGLKAGSYETGLTVEAAQGSVTRTATARLTLRHGPLDRVVLSPTTVTLDVVKAQEFKAEAVDSYGNPIPEAKITWQVAGQVGTIDDKGHLRTGTKAGTFGRAVKATASLGRDSKEATASVTIKPGPPTRLSIPPIALAAGEAQQLKSPFVADQYGNPVGEVKWTMTVRDANAGSLSATGLFTAGRVAGSFKGSVEARTAEGLSATTSVTIRPGPLTLVVIAPNPPFIGVEMTQQFVAVGADRFGNRISGLNFTWNVEAGGGTIDANGLFAAGTTPGTFANTVKATVSQGTRVATGTAYVVVEPDRILFQSDRSGRPITTTTDGRTTTFKSFDLHIMNIDGTNVQKLSTGQTFIEGHSSTPDGRRIVWERNNGVVAMGDDALWGAALHSESFAALHPAVSPDGKRIAYHSREGDRREIYVMDIDGGNRVRLTNNAADDNHPAWSPDGRQIAFMSDRDGNREIYLMNADGTNQRRLTNHPNIDERPQWSPDGAEILFHSNRDGDFEVYIMRADGTNLSQITSNSVIDGAPSWSPDGARIVFVSNRDGNREIYVMDRNGANVTRLTNNTAEDDSPSWIPRKRGVEVSEASVVVTNASALRPTTTQEVTAKAQGAVVRIKTDLGSGSGFAIDPNGLILTNNHVIRDAKEITVFLDNGKSFKGTMQGRDLVRDLAVVKIEASSLPTLELGDLSQLQLGSDVVVLGYPLGSTDRTVTRGVASAFKIDRGRNIRWVQTDSAINPGNSGGPLLNLQGQVVGVVTLARFEAENVGFAVAANTVRLYLDRLKAGEVIAN